MAKALSSKPGMLKIDFSSSDLAINSAHIIVPVSILFRPRLEYQHTPQRAHPVSAAAAVLTDYGALPPGQRNILRLIFCDPRVRAAQYDWESVARFVVGAFRADAARAGAVSEVGELVDELCKRSPEFAALWRDNNVHVHGEGIKRLRHAILGPIMMEYSAFGVDGRPDLGMVVYNPATRSDADRIRSLVRSLPVQP